MQQLQSQTKSRDVVPSIRLKPELNDEAVLQLRSCRGNRLVSHSCEFLQITHEMKCVKVEVNRFTTNTPKCDKTQTQTTNSPIQAAIFDRAPAAEVHREFETLFVGLAPLPVRLFQSQCCGTSKSHQTSSDLCQHQS